MSGELYRIPAGAGVEWDDLAAALEVAGPVPCRVSAVPDAWWSKVPGLVERARAGCSTCLVSVECVAYAVAAREPEGMWGGMTPAERRDFVAGGGAA